MLRTLISQLPAKICSRTLFSTSTYSMTSHSPNVKTFAVFRGCTTVKVGVSRRECAPARHGCLRNGPRGRGSRSFQAGDLSLCNAQAFDRDGAAGFRVGGDD